MLQPGWYVKWPTLRKLTTDIIMVFGFNRLVLLCKFLARYDFAMRPSGAATRMVYVCIFRTSIFAVEDFLLS